MGRQNLYSSVIFFLFLLILLSVLLAVLMSVYRPTGPVVRTQNGLVQGSVEKDIEGGEYYSFKGIPFAAPPVGELRFKDPQPSKSWNGVRKTTIDPPACAQILNDSYYGEEDCLFLNVYSKNVKSKSPLPVMVYVFGGQYFFGDGRYDSYGPEYLLRRDVIVITFNFRLSILGFIDLKHEVAPGNAGMKDIVMVLKWVRNNIVNFGGDPQRVTIFGDSSGAASVHFLAQSPLTKGLVHRVICESGVAISPWAYRPQSQNYTYQVAELLGKKTHDPKECVNFLRTIDSKKLQETAEKIRTPEIRRTDGIIFGPTRDQKSKEPFFPEDLTVAAARGVQLPFLLGYTSREGIIETGTIRENGLDRYNNEFESTLHPAFRDLLKQYELSPERLKNLYFKGANIIKKNSGRLLDLVGDVNYVESIHRAVKIQVLKSSFPTYLYQYTYYNFSDPAPEKVKLQTNAPGACHADELVNLFRQHTYEQLSIAKPIQKETPRFLLMQRLTDMWVNFASTGNPTPTKTQTVPIIWQPVNNDTYLRYLEIDTELKMKTTKTLQQLYDHSQHR